MFGIDFSPEGLLNFFSAYAYDPLMVYSFIILFMTLSSFGLPVPEEVVLISCGLIVYLAKNPEKFPPPEMGAEPVELSTMLWVCFLAVFLSDLLVYFIGLTLGQRLLDFKWFQKLHASSSFKRIQNWFSQYGAWCCGIFRFTPGLRFPGHLSCGFLKIPPWKFILVDGLAALFSVPTQVYLVSEYGGDVIEKLQEIKTIALIVIGFVFIVWLIRRRIKLRAIPPIQ